MFPLAQDKKAVEFNFIENDEMPPIIITMDEDDNPKVVINRNHTIFIKMVPK